VVRVPQEPAPDLLRIATIGSVDDGKSTLIGRLLVESGSIYRDQLASVERTSQLRGDEYLDIALITDGLRAEREQSITIDVAYRFLSTPRRRFILLDCPGHVQYTRNMVTGASKADVVLIVLDVRRGVLEQSRRHATIASLLRVPHAVVCVNKMDLVDWSEDAFDVVRAQFEDYAARLSIVDTVFIPTSALVGDNLTRRSEHMQWYEGPTLLYHLDHVYHGADRNLIDLRFPVQLVIRPHSSDPLLHDYRAYAGQVVSGVVRPGEPVVILPAGIESTIESVSSFDGPLTEAYPPMSVRLTLMEDLDIARGDVICRPGNRPQVGQDLEAVVCSLTPAPLRPGNA